MCWLPDSSPFVYGSAYFGPLFRSSRNLQARSFSTISRQCSIQFINKGNEKPLSPLLLMLGICCFILCCGESYDNMKAIHVQYVKLKVAEVSRCVYCSSEMVMLTCNDLYGFCSSIDYHLYVQLFALPLLTARYYHQVRCITWGLFRQVMQILFPFFGFVL